MLLSTGVHLIRRPCGAPEPTDFGLRVNEVSGTPAPEQLVVRNDWFSVDPYMRGLLDDADSYVAPFVVDAPLDGAAVGTVIASGTPAIPLGTQVLHELSWREYALVDAASIRPIDTPSAPAHAYLGALGGPGMTAYVGLTRIAPVRPGDVAFISGAAGAVGFSVITVAQQRGAAVVIGSAGGPQKVERLLIDFGVHAAINNRLGRLWVTCATTGESHCAAPHLKQPQQTATRTGQSHPRRQAPPYIAGFIVTDHWGLHENFLTEAKQWMTAGSCQTNTQRWMASRMRLPPSKDCYPEPTPA